MHTGSYGLTAAGSHPPAAETGMWPVRSGVAPPLAEGFITRTEMVPGLETGLVPGAVVALVPGEGARASGKTQLAAYLAESLRRSGEADLLAWVDAASRASVLSGYRQAATELGLDHGGDAEAVAARFLAGLAAASRPWLVVLDDVRDAADLDGLMPAGPAGRVLITAADAATVPGVPRAVVFAVPAFSTREALNYLSGRLSSDPDQRNGAIDLVSELGGEPAALSQAAAVILSSGIRCSEYREYLAQRRAQITADAGPLPAAAVTWALCAWYAGQLAPGGGIYPLLALAALLGGQAVPGTVFTAPATCEYLKDEGACTVADPQGAWFAVQALQQAGLLSVDTTITPPAVWVSRGLQAVVRSAAPPDLLGRAGLAAASALTGVWPAGQPRSWSAVALRSCAASLQLAAGDALWTGGGCPRVLLAAGHSLDDARLTGPAVSWWRDLTAASQRILGPGHADTFVTGGLLADALLAAGQAAEAVTWFEWVLGRRSGMLGPDHPGTIAARVSLGRALAGAGKPGDAVAVLDQAARHSEQVHGPSDEGTLAAWDQYAAACLAAGQPREAIHCYQRSLDGRERLAGPDHPGVLAARLQLAGACLAAGKTRDAIALCKRVLAGLEQALGAGHPDTLAARARLADAYDAAGQMGAALQLRQEACAGYEAAFGDAHPDTLASYAGLARAYSAAGQAGEAVRLLRDVIDRSEQVLSPGDPLTLALRQALAEVTGEMSAG
jgi:tetratricopeptide (TPR) repeat protein